MSNTLNWKGPWSAGATYQIYDVVYYLGSSYVSIVINTDTPPTLLYIGTIWEPLAISGAQGAQGAPGTQGPQGVPGSTGAQGAQGTQGPQGAPGSTIGVVGPPGPPGSPGTPGETGAQGVQGPRGVPGSTGAQGATGAQGPQGVPGSTGAQGPQGIPGPQGVRGPVGATGPIGLTGQGFVWRNTWLSGVTYNQYDCVAYEGNSYICVGSNVLNSPPSLISAEWNVLALGSSSTLATVAFTGSYTDLINTPGPYTFSQSAASTTWLIIHNLNTYPTVTVIDSAGSTIIGEIQYNSLNQCTLIFSAAFSGTAVLV